MWQMDWCLIFCFLASFLNLLHVKLDSRIGGGHHLPISDFLGNHNNPGCGGSGRAANTVNTCKGCKKVSFCRAESLLMKKKENCSLQWNYLASPSSSLLYSAISISRRVLISRRIWYSLLCLSRSVRNEINCSSRLVTWRCKVWSCIEYRASVSAKVPSRAAFWRRKWQETKWGKKCWLHLFADLSIERASLWLCTMLSWDCSSISRFCSVRRSSVTSDFVVDILSVLAATCLFNSVVCSRPQTPCHI